MLMIAPTGPHLPVPTRRRDSRVERAGRADSQSGGQERRPASLPAPVRRDQTLSTTPAALPAAKAAAATCVALQAYPLLRGLRADETERRRYRAAYQRASEPAALPVAPRLERTA